ncbi:MAG: Lysophospholipid transporter LplT [Chlamydiales bacterium]|nr:Lysophospholipid transporter LplT [Chlamydiales bacterium]
MEILTTSLAVLAFTFHSAIGGYAVLFLLATQSALFSPCKYGIIPEIVPKAKISHYNGVITATTYLAIILGTFFASFLTEVTHKNFIFAASICVLIAVFGLFASFGIEKTPARAKKKKVSTHFISDIIKSLISAKKQCYLLTTLVFGAYFLFMGAYTQLNIIPFTLQSLHMSEVHGGYLFLMTAIGIGIGSYLAGRFSGKEVELGFVPLAAFGIGVCFIALYLFSSNFFIVVPLLILIGLFGGFYVVPIDSFIQIASPDKDRGQNVATSNFLSFIGVIIASGLIAFLGNALNLSAASGFFVVGITTLMMAVVLLLLYADQVLRLLVSVAARSFLQIRVWGKSRIHHNKRALLVAPRTSWLDTLIVMATLPRLIRYIVPIQSNQRKRLSFLYRLLWLVPMDIEHYSPIGPEALKIIEKELKAGHSVCLMHPEDFTSKNLQDWEAKLEELLKGIEVPVMPVHISKQVTPKKIKILAQLKSLRRGIIRVSYGSVVK